MAIDAIDLSIMIIGILVGGPLLNLIIWLSDRLKNKVTRFVDVEISHEVWVSVYLSVSREERENIEVISFWPESIIFRPCEGLSFYGGLPVRTRWIIRLPVWLAKKIARRNEDFGAIIETVLMQKGFTESGHGI